MKSKDVLTLLKVTRVTLMNYVKSGKIKATKMGNGLYDYDETSIFAFLKKDIRSDVIYCRVSTYKQKNDLVRQVDSVIDFCKKNNVQYSTIYKDISSGTDLDRKNFSALMDNVINYKIRNIYITYKDRLTRLSFKTIEQLFNELISIVHHFSTQTYSKRRKAKLEIIKKDIDLFE